MTITNKKLLELFEENRPHKDTWLSDDLIDAFVQIINHAAGVPKLFVQLTCRDDMKTYCLSRCIKAWHCFDKNKSNNPYAYLTTVVHSAAYHYICTQRHNNKQKNTNINANAYDYAMKAIRS